MFKSLLLYELCILIFMLKLKDVNTGMSLKAKNLECFHNSEFYRNVSCRLKAISWKKTLANIEAVLQVDLHSAFVHGQVFKRYNTYQPFLFNVSFDYCSMLESRGPNYFFATFVRTMFKKYTNFDHPCPFAKDQVYYGRNIDFDLFKYFDISVGTIGVGRYRLDVDIYLNGQKVKAATVRGYGDVMDR